MRYFILIIVLVVMLQHISCGGENKITLNKLNDYSIKIIEKLDITKSEQFKECDFEELRYIHTNVGTNIYNRRTYWQVIDSLAISSITNNDTLFIFEQFSSGEVETYQSIVYKSNKMALNGCAVIIQAGSEYQIKVLKNRKEMNNIFNKFNTSVPIILTYYFRDKTNMSFICNDRLIHIPD